MAAKVKKVVKKTENVKDREDRIYDGFAWRKGVKIKCPVCKVQRLILKAHAVKRKSNLCAYCYKHEGVFANSKVYMKYKRK